MTKAIIVNSLKDAIIDTFCEFEIIQNEHLQHLIGKTDKGYIDIDKTWLNALSNLDIDHILEQINYHCDYDTIIDHWQQIALDTIDEDDLSEDELDDLYRNDKLGDYYSDAMFIIEEIVKEHFDEL